MLYATHTAIRDVTERIEKFEFNTYISGMMILLNDLSDVAKKATDGGSDAYRLAMSEALETLVLLIGPAAPRGDEVRGDVDGVHRALPVRLEPDTSLPALRGR